MHKIDHNISLFFFCLKKHVLEEQNVRRCIVAVFIWSLLIRTKWIVALPILVPVSANRVIEQSIDAFFLLTQHDLGTYSYSKTREIELNLYNFLLHHV